MDLNKEKYKDGYGGKYTFDDLVKIIEILRAPGGCPWDREQTHESIRKNVVEEAYEMVEAIDSRNEDKIADESGDVLLQVVLHAQIAKDGGNYDINDVTDIISRKMIHRHPHVFGSTSVKNSDEVLQKWDAIKRSDRSQTSVCDDLKGVSKYIPTLMRAQKSAKRRTRRVSVTPHPNAAQRPRNNSASCSLTLRRRQGIWESTPILLFRDI